MGDAVIFEFAEFQFYKDGKFKRTSELGGTYIGGEWATRNGVVYIYPTSGLEYEASAEVQDCYQAYVARLVLE